jgi:ketosteroid isomerase-like protein
MSQADIETLRAGYEAFNRGDWDAVFRGAHPDFELKTADRVTSPGTYRGHAEVTRFFSDFFEPFEEVVVEPQKFFDRGEQIVAFVLVRSRPMGSSAVIENRIAHLWTIRDGMVARLQVFPAREEALEAVGLSE